MSAARARSEFDVAEPLRAQLRSARAPNILAAGSTGRSSRPGASTGSW